MKYTHLPHWHRSIHALHFGFLNGLVAIVFMATIGYTVASPLWVKRADAAVSSFSGSSFWNAPVPAYTTLNPTSSQIGATIAQQVSSFGADFNNSATAPVYTVGPETPTVTVVPWNCGVSGLTDLSNQWQSVPIPFYAVPGGTNAQMVIYQPSSGTTWEFGHLRNIAGQWQACTGGRISTLGEGIFPSPYGVSSSGLAVLAGQLTVNELRSGYIDHVIGLTLPRTNGFISPATQGSGSDVNAPPMGLRLRLDPSVNVQSLGLNSAGTAIARAAQTYGFVVWNTGPTVSVSGENPISLTSRTIPNPYAGIDVANSLQGFPWDKLQSLPTGASYASVIPAITALSGSPATITAGGTVTLAWQSNNVNRCAIPGLGDNLPASGSIVTKPLQASTTFVLRCGGSSGTASSQVSITVLPISGNDRIATLPPATVIEQPYSGYANILPDIMTGVAAEKVYKVIYYEANAYLFETAKPPFALNTARMGNGKHVVEAQIYYRDGTSDKKSLGFTVSNTPETLFATVQSGVISAPTSIPLPYTIAGTILAFGGMAVGSWWGWRKAHLV